TSRSMSQMIGLLALAPLAVGCGEQSVITADGDGSISMYATLVSTVTASVETDPVPSSGDAADDMTVWVHPTDVSKSLVIGADKRGGIASYELSGEELEYLKVGELNNVDIRYNFKLGSSSIPLIMASNRSNDSISAFTVNPSTRKLQSIGSISNG